MSVCCLPVRYRRAPWPRRPRRWCPDGSAKILEKHSHPKKITRRIIVIIPLITKPQYIILSELDISSRRCPRFFVRIFLYNSLGLFFLSIFSSPGNFLPNCTGGLSQAARVTMMAPASPASSVTIRWSLKRYSNESEAMLLAITLPSSAKDKLEVGRAQRDAISTAC